MIMRIQIAPTHAKSTKVFRSTDQYIPNRSWNFNFKKEWAISEHLKKTYSFLQLPFQLFMVISRKTQFRIIIRVFFFVYFVHLIFSANKHFQSW